MVGETLNDFRVRDIRRPGHHWADNEILDVFAPKMGAYAYAVYMYISRHANNNTGISSKSQRDIANTLDISVDTVQRSIAKLVEIGLIAVEHVYGSRCIYTILEVNKPTANSGSVKNDTPLTAVPLPPIAVPLPLTAVHNKETILLQDSINTKPKPKAQAPFGLPNWILPDVWAGFEEMRKKIRKPMTDRARKLIINELDKLRNRGHPANDCLEQSTRNCWQDVYEIRDKVNGNGAGTSKADRRSTQIREATERIFRDDPAFHEDNAGCLPLEDIRQRNETLEGDTESLFLSGIRDSDEGTD